jgi:hypothetical protein
MNYKQQCIEMLSRALAKEPYNKYYQSLFRYFGKHGTLTKAQFDSLKV